MKIHEKEQVIEKAQKEKIIQTSCDGCVFGEPQSNDNENLSDYCKLDRLDKLQKSGAEIISVGTSQQGSNYKIINNRVCNMLRGDTWKEVKEQKGIKESELKEEARKETQIRCHFLVYMRPGDFTKNLDEKGKRQNYKKRINDVCVSVKSIEDGNISPKKITIVNNSEIGPYDFVNYFRIQSKEMGVKSEWNMEYIKEEASKASTGEESYNRCIDFAFRNVKTHYFCVFFEGEIVPKNYLSKIDSAINDDLERFLLLMPQDGHGGFFSQTLAYKQFGGNKRQDFITKIKEESKEQECQNIIRPLSQIIKSL